MMKKEKCTNCPLLQMAAEVEQMAGCGIIPGNDDSSFQRRMIAIVIGRMRDQRGCSGPVGIASTCRYYYEAHSMPPMTLDPNVPLLKHRIEDGQDRKYI